MIDDDEFRPLTIWVVGDMDTSGGQALLASAFSHLVSLFGIVTTSR